jgi:hypothetical protein
MLRSYRDESCRCLCAFSCAFSQTYFGGVPTVDLRPPRDSRCSMAYVGGMPPASTSSGGRLHDAACVNFRDSSNGALAFVKPECQTRVDLPDANAGDHIELAARNMSRLLRLFSR